MAKFRIVFILTLNVFLVSGKTLDIWSRTNQCEGMPEIDNGKVQPIVVGNQVLAISCDNGFTYRGGKPEISCELGNQWRHQGQCVPKCLDSFFNQLFRFPNITYEMILSSEKIAGDI